MVTVWSMASFSNIEREGKVERRDADVETGTEVSRIGKAPHDRDDAIEPRRSCTTMNGHIYHLLFYDMFYDKTNFLDT